MPKGGRLTRAGPPCPLGVTSRNGAQPEPLPQLRFAAVGDAAGGSPSPEGRPRRYLPVEAEARARARTARAGRSPRPAARPPPAPLNGSNGGAPPPRPFLSGAHSAGLVWVSCPPPPPLFFPSLFPLPCQLTPSSAEAAAFDLRAAGSGEARGRFSSPASRTLRTPALPSGERLRRGRARTARPPSPALLPPPLPRPPGRPVGWRGACAGAPPARGRAGLPADPAPAGLRAAGRPRGRAGGGDRSAGGRGAAAPKNCSRLRGTQIRREQRTSHQSRLIPDCSAAEGGETETERGERQSRGRRRRGRERRPASFLDAFGSVRRRPALDPLPPRQLGGGGRDAPPWETEAPRRCLRPGMRGAVRRGRGRRLLPRRRLLKELLRD